MSTKPIHEPIHASRPGTPDTAWETLITGNQKFASGHRTNYETKDVNDAIAAAQHPWATIISCIDSRVPPELIFDCKPGDLFVVRTAGQVVWNEVLASIEFTVAEAVHASHYGVPLIVVLGHSSCGAVDTTVKYLESKYMEQNPPLPGYESEEARMKLKEEVDAITEARTRWSYHIMDVAKDIAGSLGNGNTDLGGTLGDDHKERVRKIINRNTISRTTESLRESHIIMKAIRDGKLKVRAALFDLDTRLVTAVQEDGRDVELEITSSTAGAAAANSAG